MPIGDWRHNPVIEDMPQEKIQFLSKLLDEMQGKNTNNMMPFLMAVTTRAGQAGIQFSDEETMAILNVLMPNMTPEEKKKVDMIRKMVDTISKKKK